MWNYLAHNKIKLREVVKVIYNLVLKYPETKDYKENNMKEVGEGERLTVEEAIHLVCFV